MSVTASAVTNATAVPGVGLVGQFPDLLNRQFDKLKMRVWAQPSEGLQFFTQDKVNRTYSKKSSITGLGLVPKSDDEDPVPVDFAIQGFDHQIDNQVLRLSVRISQTLLESDQYGQIKKMQSALLKSGKDTVEYYAADAFNTGFGSNASWLCADGMYLFDTARPFEDPSAGTWDNAETGSALTQASLETMRINFSLNKNERGLLAPIMMEKLIVPPALEQKAYELIKSDKRAEDSLNAVNHMKNKVEICVWRYLTSSTAWFGMGPKDDLHELYWDWRVRPEAYTYDAADNPNVKVHMVRMAFGTGCTRPQNLRGNAGS